MFEESDPVLLYQILPSLKRGNPLFLPIEEPLRNEVVVDKPTREISRSDSRSDTIMR